MAAAVSIVVVTHNALPYTRVLFSSLRRTRGVAFETVVVDNASSARTRAYLSRLQRRGTIDTLCLRSDNPLFARAVNLGVRLTDPDSQHVLLLNPDVEIRDPRWLTLLLEAHCGGATGYGLLTDEAGPRTDGYCLLVDRALMLAHPLDEDYPGWWCVARLQAELLAAGVPVRAVSDHDHLLFHFGRKSGPGFETAAGAATSAETVRAWFAGRFPQRISAHALLPPPTRPIGPPTLGRRSRALARLEDRSERMGQRLEGLMLTAPARLEELSAAQAAQSAQAAELKELIKREHEQTRRILRSVVAEDSANRRRVIEARATDDYEQPFSDPAPLVSIVIPTHDRAALLRERSVASALRQSHEHLEVIVVGDDSPDEVEEAVRSLDDPRVRFHRLSTPYRASDDPRAQWRVRSVVARNEGMSLARGSWLLGFDDDDEMSPDQVERLLDLARQSRAEVSYGLAVRHWQDGSSDTIGVFPPVYGQFAWQCAIYHGGLRFFHRQLVATEFGLPSDWFMCEAMLRAGVRFAMLEEPICAIYPSPAMHAERDRGRAEAAAALATNRARPAAGARRPGVCVPVSVTPVTPWEAPSRFGPAGWVARQALRRVIRPLEVRQRETNESLARAVTEQNARMAELESRLESVANGSARNPTG
jgi:glycosyltransferase involved in cell wall biosynthesis